MTRLVLDASVLLSGVISRPASPPARLFAAARTDRFNAIACPHLIGEFRRGLAKPYFAARFSPREASRILDAYVLVATMLADPVDPPRVVSDPSDDYLVALAKNAEVEAIVTGDRGVINTAGTDPPAIDPREACIRLGLLDN